MEQLDFQKVFDVAPGAHLLLRPDFTICAANEAYLKITMTRLEDILGRNVFDVFPGDPNDTQRDDSGARASMQYVLREKKPHQLSALRYAIRRPLAEGGAYEERYWSTLNTPVLADDGEVALILHTVDDVTKVVQLQREKRDVDRDLSEVTARSERFVELLDSAPDAIVITGDDGLIQLVNLQTEKLFGYPRSELIGRPLELLVPERFRGGHAEHIRRFFTNPTARPMGTGLSLFGRCKDGREIPIEVSLSPHPREGRVSVSAAIRDISERKRLEASARLNADRLANAVEAIQDAFALFDAGDRLVLCNKVYWQLLRARSANELVGKSFDELFDAWTFDMEFESERERVAWRDEQREKRRSEPTSVLDVRLRDGRRMRVIDRHTSEGGIVKTIWDLTSEEMRAQELREARAAAEAASEAKSDFLASMSHELRTPMNAILGFAQLLQRDRREPLSERHRERVGHILTGGEHLLRLIDDVLDLARIEAGRVSVFTESVPVAAVLEDVRKTLEPLAARYEVQLKIERSEHCSLTLAVDRTRFAQILINFGSNAIKYNRPGGKVTFRCTQPTRATVRVTVEDDGIGIPLDKQSKLFQPFQRAGQETGPIEGTGIGLVITRRLASLMGGDIGFHSEPERGSQFWVEMPMKATPSLQTSTPSDEIHSLPVERDEGERTVLYVEDNPANVTFMRDLIGSLEGVELLTASTAEEGIELAHLRQPAAILMDINLPGMSGLEALRVLREGPRTQHIPVIALTAAASERDQDLGMQAGFFRYLTKPVRVDELLLALEQVLANVGP
ncbi:MAG TPA: PAS domain S-box protein [Polyangiales bacterium]